MLSKSSKKFLAPGAIDWGDSYRMFDDSELPTISEIKEFFSGVYFPVANAREVIESLETVSTGDLTLDAAFIFSLPNDAGAEVGADFKPDKAKLDLLREFWRAKGNTNGPDTIGQIAIGLSNSGAPVSFGLRLIKKFPEASELTLKRGHYNEPTILAVTPETSLFEAGINVRDNLGSTRSILTSQHSGYNYVRYLKSGDGLVEIAFNSILGLPWIQQEQLQAESAETPEPSKPTSFTIEYLNSAFEALSAAHQLSEDTLSRLKLLANIGMKHLRAGKFLLRGVPEQFINDSAIAAQKTRKYLGLCLEEQCAILEDLRGDMEARLSLRRDSAFKYDGQLDNYKQHVKVVSGLHDDKSGFSKAKADFVDDFVLYKDDDLFARLDSNDRKGLYLGPAPHETTMNRMAEIRKRLGLLSLVEAVL